MLPTPHTRHAATSHLGVFRRAKVHAVWKSIAKDERGQVERLKCWSVLLNDDELADIVGKSATHVTGKA